ncbi:MAG: hypothetical protein H6821_01075 [Planctomycetaceae bacterium]|nr:hypothetical protein [Planctomycetales bacterium]MCB9872743.1 hypothetical protein [Planctomycetaceae bacterium]MCB9926229.1 hypothetical protein [Planctomycetaceae bacterium]
MAVTRSIRHTHAFVWTFVGLLGLILVLAELTRTAGAVTDDPSPEPSTVYIVSPSSGVFVPGMYRGGAPCVEIGSRLEPGTVVGSIEVWGRLRPIHSTVSGSVVEILIFNDAMVAPKQPLFKVQLTAEPAAA